MPGCRAQARTLPEHHRCAITSAMREWLRGEGPFEMRNPRLFVAFSALYHARAYYPVFAILFLDLGLSDKQFFVLNAVWAASILLLEVPSGALADVLGRRRLLIFGAATMVIEMGLLLFAPRDGGTWLFVICLLNRFMSGLSEAAASGADEAIAYEAIKEEGRAKAWDVVLVNAMRWRSGAFLVAMTLGGLMYDPSWWNAWAPESLHLSVDIARRLPVAMVLMQGLACLWIAFRFEEVREPSSVGVMDRLREATRLTLATARKAVSTRAIAVVLVGGMLLDAIARNQATLNSMYYRLLSLPEWTFGFFGSVIAVCNWFVPGIAAWINRRCSTVGSLLWGACVALMAGVMLVPAWVWIGLPAVMLMMMLMGYANFTVGRFLHSQAGSHQRATMLSIKSMGFNLAYGLYTLSFAGLVSVMRGAGELERLHHALGWQVAGFAGLLIGYFVITRIFRSRANRDVTDLPTP